MLLAALLDLDAGGSSLEILRRTVQQLGLHDVEVQVQEVVERGFRASRVTVAVSGDQPTRSPADLDALLAASGLDEWVKDRSRAALGRLAEVEAGLHGVPLQDVHFHEIGAMDSLVDVAGCFALMDALGRPRVVHGPVPLGAGSITTAHGTMRAPAPATLELLKGRPCWGGPETAETTTPTGALLLSELADSWGPMPPMLPHKVGYGAGHKELSGPNLLRAVWGTKESAPDADDRRRGGREEVLLLQCDLDDSSGELLGCLADSLREAGALDLWMSPLLMKKGRPGVELSVLATPGTEEPLLDLLFVEGTTFGVRELPVARHTLARDWVTVPVGDQDVRVKVGRWQGRIVTVAPEFCEAAAAAGRLARSTQEVYQEAAVAARRRLGEGLYGSALAEDDRPNA